MANPRAVSTTARPPTSAQDQLAGPRPQTVVVNLHKSRYDVYIGRGSKWGNPFVIGRDGTREQVIEKYRQHLRNRPDLLQALPELRGKLLGCFCKPKPCHGDIFVELLGE